MSATAAPVPQARPPLDAVAFVAGLADEEKHAVFLALLREAMAESADAGLIPVVDENDRPYGYYVTPGGSEELYRLRGPQLTEAEEAALDARLAGLEAEPKVPLTEVIADLKRRLAGLPRRP